jgi:hypothetical protein
MKEMAPGVYEVSSDSDASRTYVVNLTGQHPQCTCTHYAIQRNRQAGKGLPPLPCKHIRSVQRMNPDAFKAQKEAETKARSDAEAAKVAADQAKRQKMAAELAAMRDELGGTAKTETPVPVIVETVKRVAEAEPDLMAQLEAKINERRKQ